VSPGKVWWEVFGAALIVVKLWLAQEIVKSCLNTGNL